MTEFGNHAKSVFSDPLTEMRRRGIANGDLLPGGGIPLAAIDPRMADCRSPIAYLVPAGICSVLPAF
ncbi:MAG: hypothetical protein JSW31_18390 [Burkholderiales bacterium]|nr:MAG: hypothetical protein JSW31_18390 [Burkholderiales bacterium]